VLVALLSLNPFCDPTENGVAAACFQCGSSKIRGRYFPRDSYEAPLRTCGVLRIGEVRAALGHEPRQLRECAVRVAIEEPRSGTPTRQRDTVGAKAGIYRAEA